MSNRLSLSKAWLFIQLCAVGLVGGPLNPFATSNVAFAADAKPHLVFDDASQPLLPQTAQSEADADRVEALTLFTAGHAHERRGELAEALRCYQRAMRRDPASPTLIEAVLSLTIHLKRESETARYALLATDFEGADPLLMQVLSAHYIEQANWPLAISLQEKALAVSDRQKQLAEAISRRMTLGRLCCMADRYKEAAEYFTRVLYALDHRNEFSLDEESSQKMLGNAAITYQRMGDCLLIAGRIDEARAAFDKLEQVAPSPVTRQYNLARLQLKRGKSAEALAALDACFAARISGQGTAPYETLAAVLVQLGKKDELIGRLEKLRAAEPDNLLLGYYLAEQYQAADQTAKAEELYRKLLTVHPSLIGYRSLVDLYRQAKRPDALLDALGNAIERTGVLHALGAEAQTVSNDVESIRGIIATARTKLKTEPEKLNYGQRIAAALLALEAKQYEAAGEFFDCALAAQKKLPSLQTDSSESSPPRADELLMVWGVGLITGDRAAEAARVFQRAIDEKVTNDDNPIFHFYLAGALALAKRPEEALAAARIAADRKKDSARFQGRPAWVLYAAKRYDEATKVYLELLARFDADRTSTETRDVLREARLTLSNIAVLQGDMLQAEEWLEQVLDEFPDDSGAMNDLGYLWADQDKHLLRAHRMIARAVEANPDNGAYRDSLGWVLFRLARYSEALVELQKAAHDKADGVVLDHLGDTYWKLKRSDKAAEAWHKAVSAFHNEHEAEKAKAVEQKIAKAAIQKSVRQ